MKRKEFHKGDQVLVFGRWKGEIQGSKSSIQYIVTYTKNGSKIIDFVSKSNLIKIK